MTKFNALLTASATKIPALAVAHDMAVNEIDGFHVKTRIDLAVIDQRLPRIAGTFIPKEHRHAVMEALERLSARIADSGLDQPDTDAVTLSVDNAIRQIDAQPEKMAHAPNGAAHTDHKQGQQGAVTQTSAN